MIPISRRPLLAVLLPLAACLHDPASLAESFEDEEPAPEVLPRMEDPGRRKGALHSLQAIITDAHGHSRYERSIRKAQEQPVPPPTSGSSPVPDSDDVTQVTTAFNRTSAARISARLSHAEAAVAKAKRGLHYTNDTVEFWTEALFFYFLWICLCAVVACLCFWHDSESDQKVDGGQLPDATKQPETSWRGGFRQQALETKWLQISYGRVMSDGALSLFGAAVGFIIYRSIRFERRSGPGSCLPVYWPLAATELSSVALVMCASFFCMYRPGPLYWVLLAFFSFYILAAALPPFAFSCEELVEQCFGNKIKFIIQATRHADCSLEGYTSQQTIMMWILAFPWTIPRLSMMPLAWFWIIVVYFSWTLCYIHHMPWMTFSWNSICFHFVLLNFVFLIAVVEKQFLEHMQRMTFLADLRMKNASYRLFSILRYMVPDHVILPMIRRPGEVIADQVDRVSILFIIIDDFDEIAERLSPAEVLGFLNENFTKFDRICEANKVTKIETVGEEYVACVGVMPEDRTQGHSQSLGRLILAADQILKLQTDSVRFKMGLHTGPIVAGVIGQRLPRYRLFGDTINMAARMMQKGEVGQLQFGEETHQDLPSHIRARLRGVIELKGKGPVKAYLCEEVNSHEAMAPTLRPKRESIFAAMMAQENKGPKPKEGCNDTYGYSPPLVQSASNPETEDSENASGDDIALHEDGNETFEQILASAQEEGDWEFAGVHGEEWKRWHHQKKVCHRCVPGLDMQFAVVFLLTIIELTFMYVVNETDRTNRGIPGCWRIPLFLSCRATVLLFIGGWRIALASDVAFIQENPDTVMYGRLITWGMIAIIVFISYDDLTPDDIAEVKEGDTMVETAPFSQNFSLVFVFAYTISTRMEGMLFKPSLVFIAIAIALMANAEHVGNENIVQSLPAKVFFIVNQIMSCVVCYADEQTSRAQYKAKISMEATTARVQGILSTLMPPLVLEELRTLPPGAPQPTHTYRAATICQSDLCGFTKLAATRSPREVVGFMGDLFGRFDDLTSKCGVYKVETVGDAYIAGVAEAPLTPTNAPLGVLLFGLAMIDAVHAWARDTGESVTCRVGVHYGECIGGVVGTGMQRYHLFGKLLVGLEILESTAPEGHVQISSACKTVLEKQGDSKVQGLVFKLREDAHMTTSKGLIHEYDSVGGRTFIVSHKGDIGSHS